MTRVRLSLVLGGVVALSLLVRLPFLSVPLTTDEAGYAYVAHWLDRGLALYRDLWFDRPQGIFLVYGAILRVFGGSTEAIRLGAAAYNALTVVLLYFLGRSWFGRRAGLAAAAIFAGASASPVIEGFTANGELFMNLPVVVCLLLASHRRRFAAGAVMALAATIKPTALPTCALALLALLLFQCQDTEGMTWRAPAPRAGVRLRAIWAWLRPLRTGGAWLVAGFGAGILPFVAHGIATDADTYWYSVVGFRVQAHSAFSVGLAVVTDLWQTAPTVRAAVFPVWLLAAAALARGGWRTRGAGLSLALLAGAALGAAAGGYWYWHYYVGILPAACLLAGAGSVRVYDVAAAVRAWHRPLPVPLTRAGRAVAATGMAAGALAAVVLNVRVVGATPEQTSWNLYQRPAYLASRKIADYIRRHTTPDDAIYATFAEADLYYLSGRRCAGRHLYWTEINRVPGAFETVLATLDDPRRRPKYIVEIDRELEVPGRALPFWRRVHELYREDTKIGPYTLYRLTDAG
jgi:hypothetical protein